MSDDGDMLIALIAALAAPLAPVALAAEVSAAGTNTVAEASRTYHRDFRVGAGYAQQTSRPFTAGAAQAATLSGAYEFVLSRGFAIGIALAYRAYPQSMNQLGYGLLLQHHLPAEGFAQGKIRPYLQYGLLMQVTRLADRPGSGTSHDTRLGGGVDFEVAGAPLFFEASYDISHLNQFSEKSLNLSYFQTLVGARL